MSTVKTNNVQIGQSVTATNNFTWYQPASPDGTVRLGNGNSGSVTDLVTLTSAGNLGIGTSSPSSFSGYHYLSIDGTTGSVLNLRSNGTSQFEINTTTSDNNISGLTALPLVFKTNNSERMRLDSSGNLGLGVTPSGTSKFETYTGAGAFNAITARFNATNSPICFGIANSNGFPYLGFNTVQVNGTDNQTYSINNFASRLDAASGGFRFFTAPSGTAGNAISFTQAMTLDASGRLYVKQTSQSGNTLQRMGLTFDGSVEWGINITTTSNSGSPINFTNASGTQIGRIDASSTTVSYLTSSDQRLKTNVKPAESAIQSILDFPVAQFDWIADGTHQDFGAVAQKAINVIPEMVSVPADPEEMWGIDWSKAVPRLIKTIQELSAELNELKQKVNA